MDNSVTISRLSSVLGSTSTSNRNPIIFVLLVVPISQGIFWTITWVWRCNVTTVPITKLSGNYPLIWPAVTVLSSVCCLWILVGGYLFCDFVWNFLSYISCHQKGDSWPNHCLGHPISIKFLTSTARSLDHYRFLLPSFIKILTILSPPAAFVCSCCNIRPTDVLCQWLFLVSIIFFWDLLSIDQQTRYMINYNLLKGLISCFSFINVRAKSGLCHNCLTLYCITIVYSSVWAHYR